MSTAPQDKKEIVLNTQTYGVKKFKTPCFDGDLLPPAYRSRIAIEFQLFPLYKKARMNGDEKIDAPQRPLPHDGKITWVTGMVDATRVYGVPEGDGEHYCYECRYDAGPLDEKWMQECDQNYLARINGYPKNQSEQKTASTVTTASKVSTSAVSDTKQDKKESCYMRVVLYATDAYTFYPAEGEYNSEVVCLHLQVLDQNLKLPSRTEDWKAVVNSSLLYPPEIIEIPLKYMVLSKTEMEHTAEHLTGRYDLTFWCDKRPIDERRKTATAKLCKQFFEGLDALLQTKCVSSVKSISSSEESKLSVSVSSNSCLSSTTTEAASSSSSSASVNASAINLLSNSMSACVLNSTNTSVPSTETKAQTTPSGKFG